MTKQTSDGVKQEAETKYTLEPYIGHRISVLNDRGAQYDGILKSLGTNNSIFMEVHRIRLTGRLTEGTWQILKRPELQRIQLVGANND